jgi:hypothetical protein
MIAALRSHILSDSALAAAVTGVYSYPAPADASFPFVLLSCVSQVEMLGTADDDSVPFGYIEEWQFDIHAETNASANAIQKLLEVPLHNQGPVALSGGITMLSCFYVGDNQLFDIEPDASRVPRIVRSKTYRIERTR